MTLDHYGVLGVKRTATTEDIQHAYRNLAFQYHPDRNAAPDAATRMVAINRAYETLGDPRLRRDYDDRTSRAIPGNEMSSAILLAAREVILRSGWRVIQDYSRTLVLESGKDRIRIIFADRLDAALMNRVCGEQNEFTVVCATFVDPCIDPRPLQQHASVIGLDLVRGTRYGKVPDGAGKSLLAPFL